MLSHTESGFENSVATAHQLMDADAKSLAGIKKMKAMHLLVVAAALYWLCFGVLGPNLKSEER